MSPYNFFKSPMCCMYALGTNTVNILNIGYCFHLSRLLPKVTLSVWAARGIDGLLATTDPFFLFCLFCLWFFFTPGFICVHFCVYKGNLLPALVCAGLDFCALCSIVFTFCWVSELCLFLRAFTRVLSIKSLVCIFDCAIFMLVDCLIKTRFSDIPALLRLTPTPLT